MPHFLLAIHQIDCINTKISLFLHVSIQYLGSLIVATFLIISKLIQLKVLTNRRVHYLMKLRLHPQAPLGA